MLIVDEWGNEHEVAKSVDLYLFPRYMSDSWIGPPEEVTAHRIARDWAKLCFDVWPTNGDHTASPRRVEITEMHSRSVLEGVLQVIESAFIAREGEFDLWPCLCVSLELRAERFAPDCKQRLSYEPYDVLDC